MVSAGQDEDRTICGACSSKFGACFSWWLASKATSLAAGRGQLCLRIAVPHKISQTAISSKSTWFTQPPPISQRYLFWPVQGTKQKTSRSVHPMT